jgi:CheY-like chemotaxis protein
MLKLRALIVDDYQDHLDTLLQCFQTYHADAKGSSGPSGAMRIVKDWNPHIIVYDGLMERVKAWEFGYLLWKNPEMQIRYASQPRPYMVALTGFVSTLQRRLCEENGYDEYRSKPIEISDVLGWLHKARDRFEKPEDLGVPS